MVTSYPSGLDSLTNPSGTSLVTSPDHAAQHANANDAIEAIESTLGTTAGTAVLKDFSAGQFPVRVNSGGTLQQSLTGGTINTTVLGTPTLTLGSDATGDLFYRSAGGTITRLAPGTAGQALKTQGAGSAPIWSSAGGSVLQVVGTTSDPTNSGTTYSTLQEMVGTLVTQTGRVFVSLNSNVYGNGAGAYYLAIKKDSDTEVGQVFNQLTGTTSNTGIMINAQYLFTGLTIGASYVFSGRWKVSAGTATAQGTARSLIMLDI